MKKRRLLLLLTVALVLTVFAVPVRAEEDNLCGPNARWKLEDGVLTIYGTGECFSRPWRGMSFHTVVVESGITMVDYEAFQDSPDLVSVTLADTVLSVNQDAFANCPKLEQIDLGSRLEFIGPGAFWNCTALKQIRLPASLRDLGRGAFYGCTALTSIDLPAGLVSMADICFQGSGLTRVELPAGMTVVGKNLFGDCAALTEVVIHLPYLTEGMFKNCSALTSVTLPAGLEAIAKSAFEGSGLTSMEIPEGVSLIDEYAFKDCTALTSVTLPSTLTRIAFGAFENAALTSVEFPVGLTDISNCSFKDSALTALTIPDTVTYVGDSAFAGCAGLTELNLSQSDATYYGSNAFAECTALTQVTIPASLTVLHNRLFSGSGLTQVEIPATVLELGSGVFSYCPNLHTVTFQDRNTELDLGDSTFEGCTSLKEITLPAGLTVLGTHIFSHSGLERIVLPEGVASIGTGAFFECTALTQVTLPQSLTYISYDAFTGCTALTGIDLPEDLMRIDFSAFYNTGLTSIVIPEGVEALFMHTFASCEDLVDVYLPAGLTVLETDTFFESPNVVLHAVEGTMAHLLALDLELPLELMEPSGDLVRYPVALTASKNGTAAISTDSAFPGQIVQIYAEADAGCLLSGLVVYYDSELELDLYLTQLDDNNFFFIMPDCAVEVVVGFFDPNNPFVDVYESDYYYAPVLWAYNAEITAGVDATHFAPYSGCTRGQVVTFLWRAMGCPEPEGTANPFRDVKETDYFYKAVLWAVENSITAGMSADTFAPNSICTRGQVVTFLWRLAGEPFPIYYYNPFTDVAEGDYYHHAVMWAVECGITAGDGEGTFSPGKNCTRGQIVTFLFRALNGQ